MANLTENMNHLAPTQFKLIIDRKNYPNLEFFAQTVQHPGVNVQAVELPFRRISSIAMAGDKLTFGELNATIIVDEDMNSYTEMFNWVKRMVEDNQTSPTTSGISTEADITISILSSHNNGNKKIRYIDCIPTGLGDIAFEATVGDVQYLTFPVSFRFTYFEIQ